MGGFIRIGLPSYTSESTWLQAQRDCAIKLVRCRSELETEKAQLGRREHKLAELGYGQTCDALKLLGRIGKLDKDETHKLEQLLKELTPIVKANLIGGLNELKASLTPTAEKKAKQALFADMDDDFVEDPGMLKTPAKPAPLRINIKSVLESHLKDLEGLARACANQRENVLQKECDIRVLEEELRAPEIRSQPRKYVRVSSEMFCDCNLHRSLKGNDHEKLTP